MSLSQASDETHRAVVSVGIGSSTGTTANRTELQATEDREIVGMEFFRAHQDRGQIELSFSNEPFAVSATSTGTEKLDETKASTIAASGRGESTSFQNLDIEWSSGETINVHVRNGAASTTFVGAYVYYREV